MDGEWNVGIIEADGKKIRGLLIDVDDNALSMAVGVFDAIVDFVVVSHRLSP